MSAILEVILPVFLVIGAGYGAVRVGWFTQSGIDGLMSFTQHFAFPVLLFRAMATLDLGRNFDPALLATFYSGALAGFLAGLFGARLLFGRSWEDAVAIGFVGLFSNSLMLGVPITERAYGADALGPNYAIVALHAPFCYLLGITVMELVRGGRGHLRGLGPRVLRAVFRNALVIGIGLGLVVNLGGIALPGALAEAMDLIVRAALPTALFALGGVLVQYRPEGDLRIIAFVCTVSLILHPAVSWAMARATGLGVEPMRSAIVTAAMAPGVNAYIFASLYGAAPRVAASAVLLGTAGTLVTASIWLVLLP